jgi:hypothetical protein
MAVGEDGLSVRAFESDLLGDDVKEAKASHSSSDTSWCQTAARRTQPERQQSAISSRQQDPKIVWRSTLSLITLATCVLPSGRCCQLTHVYNPAFR